jgi:AraC-like DNA-binding protein
MSVSVAIRRTVFSDFEAMRDIAPDEPTEIMQLGPGKMTGTLTHLSLPSNFSISTGSFSRGLRTDGVMSEHRWTIGTLLETSGPASALQRPFKPGDRVVIAPGHDRYATYRDRTTYFTTFIEPQELADFLGTHPEALDQLQPTMVHASDAATAAATIAQLKTICALLTDPAQTLSADAVEFYKRNLLELLTAPLRNAVVPQYGRPLATAALVREVDRYLAAAGNRPVHVSELCQHFHVHRRTLHRAFIDVLGMPPITFARRKRLGDVHTALLQGGPETIISAIAHEHGFADLSRFAAAYRRMFGELPSQTLRRSLPTILGGAVYCLYDLPQIAACIS